MQKASDEMDVGEWELVDDRFYEFYNKPIFRPSGVVDMNYFSQSSNFSSYPNLIPPHFAHSVSLPEKEVEDEEDVKDVPVVEDSVVATSCRPRPFLSVDQEIVSQVFFNKVKMNSDMKIDSPPRTPSREFKPQFEMGLIQFEKQDDEVYEKLVDYEQNEEQEDVGKVETEKRQGVRWEVGAITVWKWRIDGLGALCCMGVAAAAATVCIFVIGNRRQQRSLQDHKPKNQIHADDKD